MTFTTNTYAETRAIIDALHNKRFLQTKYRTSACSLKIRSSGNVQVNLYITYFELQK